MNASQFACRALTSVCVSYCLTQGYAVMAQWLRQTNTLTPGWNAIHLQVQPEPDDPDVVFSGVPVESVWAWDRQAAPPQFVQDPNSLVPQQPEWLTYFPASHPQRPLRNLFFIQGGRPLLVKLAGGESIQWIVTGKPVLSRGDWVPDTFNLAGLNVRESAPPTVATYFSGSAAHSGRQVYSLNAAGRWTSMSGSSAAQSGRAYWLQTIGGSTYRGPLYVDPDGVDKLDFGAFSEERRILLRNDGSNGTQTITVRLLESLSRPAGATGSPANAGLPALSYWDLSVTNLTNVVLAWKPMTGPLTLTLPQGAETTLRLAVRRRDFPASAIPAGVDASYQGILEVIESGGSRVLVPVSARTSPGPSLGSNPRLAVAGVRPNRAGLWAGVVSLTNVSWVGAPSTNIQQANPAFNFGDRTTPRPTGSEFQFRVLLHVDTGGQVRLLQKVMEVWSSGTWVQDTKNPGLTLPGTPGTVRLFTDEKLAAAYTGSRLRDGQPVARRLSTPAFALSEPVLMVQNGDFGTGTLSCTVRTGYDDRLNPFKHQYHPDHDNYDALYNAKLPAGVESFDIQRAVLLTFQTRDAFGANSPGWQDSEVGGIYTETVTGIHREPIHVRGSFLLRRISTVDTLN